MIKFNRIRHILALVIILASLYLVLSLALKLGSDSRKEEKLPALPRNVELSLDNIHYTETSEGIRQWDLFADKGEYDKERNITKLVGVRLVLYQTGSGGNLTLLSDQAQYHNATKDVNLSGNVLLKSASGMEFSTGRASFNASRSLVFTDDRIEFTDGGMNVTGVGMEFFVKTREVRILHDVTAKIVPGKRG